MKCLNCSYDNALDSVFCENCGKPLDRPCPNCGKPIAANAKFCKYCGTKTETTTARVAESPQALVDQYMPKEMASKIAAARDSGAVVGERRIVTILFADIKGSTAMAEKLDPEEWADIMNRAFKFLIEPIYRYEGTVARLMGDAILAFFGAPIAHEDDPQRAALAALALLDGIREYREKLQREKELDFGVRVGLNTGLVVVGNIGSDLKFEYTAMGDAINLASRMQTAAEPNTIFITENTARLIRHAFDLESRGALELKGKSEPVLTFRVVARKLLPESERGIAGLSSPLVGRERESQTLQACFTELMKGRGQIISVMGEAGLGKSRLVAELRHQVLGDIPTSNLQSPRSASNLQWLEGRSLSYETNIPYTPFVDLFTKFFKLRPEESDIDQYGKIKSQVAERMPDRAEEIAPFIAALLGIAIEGEDLERVRYLEPPQLRGKIFGAVLEFFEWLAANAPLVLVIEDLHWADSTSLDLVERLIALTDRASILLIALFRPQRQEPSWRFHEVALRDYAHRYTSIALEPLDETNARALVANLLHVEDLPEKVRALILKKAEGNPFFVEEVIRSLLDAKLVVRENDHWRATREIENIAVPNTLAGVISARLDRLDEVSKRVAQTAAVIGREFPFDVLADVYAARAPLDGSLADLQRRELVREKTRLPDLVYLFKHALTQEAAYASILMSKRRELHLRVAECLERIAPERVNEIAWHFVEAQSEARALPYLVQAGEHAAKAYSVPEAVGYFTRAVEITRKTLYPEMARRAYEGLGNALMMSYDVPHALPHFQAMIEYGKANDDIPMQVSALNKLGSMEGQWMGQFEQAEVHLLEAERLAREFEHQPGLAELYTVRCGICNMKGDFRNAARYLTESAEIGRALNIKEQEAFALAHTANTLMYMAEFDQAFEKAKEALQVAEETGNQAYIAEVKIFPFAFYHLRNGNLDLAEQSATEGVRITHKIGRSFDEAIGSFVLAEIVRLRGEYEDAIAFYQRAQQNAEQAGMPFFVASVPAAIGSVYFEISEKLIDKTLELHAFALGQMNNPMAAAGGATAYADLGFCALAIGNIDRASEMFQAGLSRPTMQGLLNRPRYFIGQALIALKQNRLDDAAKQLQDARAFVDEHAMKYFSPMIDFIAAQIAIASGDTTRALEQFARAEQLAVEMNMRPLVWQARAGQARALDALGRADNASAKRAAAKTMIDEIAALFKDEKLRAAFAENSMSKT